LERDVNHPPAQGLRMKGAITLLRCRP